MGMNHGGPGFDTRHSFVDDLLSSHLSKEGLHVQFVITWDMSFVVYSAFKTQPRREDAVLLAAIHPRLTEDDQAELTRQLLATPIDWRQLFNQADRHDVIPLLYLQLQKLPAGIVPVDVLGQFAHRAYARLVWNLHLHDVLRRLLTLLNQADISVMPLKGLLLAELLYGDCTLRPTNDLDLLVHEEDLEKAAQLLLVAGCRRHFSPEQEVGLYHYLFSYRTENGTEVLVELHHDFTSQHLTRLNVQKVWAAASPQIWERSVAWTMRSDDLFLYLCTHAMRDGLGSIKNLLDLILMIEQFGTTWSWENLVKTVHDARIEAPVWLSLWHCQQFFSVKLPSGFLDLIRPRQGLGFVVGQTLFTWRGGVLHSPLALLRSPMSTILDFLWEDSLLGKFRHLRRMLLPTSALRARRTGFPETTSVVRGYPRWLWKGCVQFATQVHILRHVRSERRSHAP